MTTTQIQLCSREISLHLSSGAHATFWKALLICITSQIIQREAFKDFSEEYLQIVLQL